MRVIVMASKAFAPLAAQEDVLVLGTRLPEKDGLPIPLLRELIAQRKCFYRAPL